jgi:hypothetical protein
MALSCGVNRKRVSYRYNRLLSAILLIKCQSWTGFAKLLVTTNFKFEKTSVLNGSSAKKINTLLMQWAFYIARFLLKHSRCAVASQSKNLAL